jgi:tRNA-specific 2-thiouridylase
MSGGVDSSVAAALLLREGHDVVGVTMRLWTLEDTEAPLHHRRCCSVDDSDDARAVCDTLGIPHYVLNFEREFAATVVDYFCREYQRGRTPNPCLACNEHVKFRPLLAKALALEADYLATGHYSRIERNGHGYELWRARDEGKDQSYVLYVLGQGELSRLLFPLGDYTKAEVRHIAAELRLPVADKPDSAEICFIPRGDYRQFLETFPQRPGDIVDGGGRVVGRHQGIGGYRGPAAGAAGPRRPGAAVRPRAGPHRQHRHRRPRRRTAERRALGGGYLFRLRRGVVEACWRWRPKSAIAAGQLRLSSWWRTAEPRCGSSDATGHHRPARRWSSAPEARAVLGGGIIAGSEPLATERYPSTRAIMGRQPCPSRRSAGLAAPAGRHHPRRSHRWESTCRKFEMSPSSLLPSPGRCSS